MEVAMTATRQIDRRSLLASTAAAGGAFVLGFEFPVPDIAHAAEDGPEINAWVIIHPDDSIILRYPRRDGARELHGRSHDARGRARM
jgi:hypothetical protein